MSTGKKRNTGHSVFQRLLSHARTHGEDFNLLLLRYSIERFLYRLSISPHADRFILKGASLFLVWKRQNSRVTKDADLLAFGPAHAENLAGVFKGLCQAASEDVDGIEFLPDTVRAVPIREEQEYGSVRVTLMSLLHQARIPLQFDIGFVALEIFFAHHFTSQDRSGMIPPWRPSVLGGTSIPPRCDGLLRAHPTCSAARPLRMPCR